jgi:hypothetical protein
MTRMTERLQVVRAIIPTGAARQNMIHVGRPRGIAAMLSEWIGAQRLLSEEHAAQALPACAIASLCRRAPLVIIALLALAQVLPAQPTLDRSLGAARHRTWSRQFP